MSEYRCAWCGKECSIQGHPECLSGAVSGVEFVEPHEVEIERLRAALSTETHRADENWKQWQAEERLREEAYRCTRHNAEHLADFELAAARVREAFFPAGTVLSFTGPQAEALELLRKADDGIVSPNFGVGECRTELSEAKARAAAAEAERDTERRLREEAERALTALRAQHDHKTVRLMEAVEAAAAERERAGALERALGRLLKGYPHTPDADDARQLLASASGGLTLEQVVGILESAADAQSLAARADALRAAAALVREFVGAPPPASAETTQFNGFHEAREPAFTADPAPASAATGQEDER